MSIILCKWTNCVWCQFFASVKTLDASNCLQVYKLDSGCHHISASVQTWLSISLILFKYSWLSLSWTRLSWITAYLEVKICSLPKHKNLTTCKKYCGKEEKLLLSSFPQYFQYISNLKGPITHIFVKCGYRISFYSILQIWYVEVRIYRSISESFGIRDNESQLYIDLILCVTILCRFTNLTLSHWFFASVQTLYEPLNLLCSNLTPGDTNSLKCTKVIFFFFFFFANLQTESMCSNWT